jgi:hypothetical protein
MKSKSYKISVSPLSHLFRHNYVFSRLSYPDFKTGETFSPAHIWQSLI